MMLLWSATTNHKGEACGIRCGQVRQNGDPHVPRVRVLGGRGWKRGTMPNKTRVAFVKYIGLAQEADTLQSLNTR